MQKSTDSHSVGPSTAGQAGNPSDPRYGEAWEKIDKFCRKTLFNYFNSRLEDAAQAEELTQEMLASLAQSAHEWHPARGQPWHLNSADILNAAALFNRLAAGGGAFARAVWRNFPPSVREKLTGLTSAEMGDEAPRQTLAAGLNKLIDGPLIYAKEVFDADKIVLSDTAQQLLTEQPPPVGVRLMRLNRLLIEDAFAPLLAPVSFREWLRRKAFGRLSNYLKPRRKWPPPVSLDEKPGLANSEASSDDSLAESSWVESQSEAFDRELAVDVFEEAWKQVSIASKVEPATLKALVFGHPLACDQKQIAKAAGLSMDNLYQQVARHKKELHFQVGRLVVGRHSPAEVAAEVQELWGILERAAARAREYQRFLDLAWEAISADYQAAGKLSLLQHIAPWVRFSPEDVSIAPTEPQLSPGRLRAEVEKAQERWYNTFAHLVLKEGFAESAKSRDKDFHKLFRCFKNQEALDKAWQKLLEEAEADRAMLTTMELAIKRPTDGTITQAATRLGIGAPELAARADEARTRFFQYVVAGLLQTADARAESRAKLKAIVLEARRHQAHISAQEE